MKICDICGQSGVELEDFSYKDATLDCCTTCDAKWNKIDDELRKQMWNRYYAHKDETLERFIASKGATNETPNNG